MKSFLNRIWAATSSTLYHGSPSKFSKFKKPNQGKDYGVGIYFTENKKEALEYIDEDEGGYLYSVELNISKPFNVRDKEQAKKLSDVLGLDWQVVLDNELWKDPSTGYSSDDADNFYLKIIDELSNIVKSQGLSWYKAYDLFDPAFKKLGFDCIHDKKKRWWVVKDPNKIKILKVTKV